MTWPLLPHPSPGGDSLIRSQALYRLSFQSTLPRERSRSFRNQQFIAIPNQETELPVSHPRGHKAN